MSNKHLYDFYEGFKIGFKEFISIENNIVSYKTICCNKIKTISADNFKRNIRDNLKKKINNICNECRNAESKLKAEARKKERSEIKTLSGHETKMIRINNLLYAWNAITAKQNKGKIEQL